MCTNFWDQRKNTFTPRGPHTPKNCIFYITEKGGILVLGICILYNDPQSEYFVKPKSASILSNEICILYIGWLFLGIMVF